MEWNHTSRAGLMVFLSLFLHHMLFIFNNDSIILYGNAKRSFAMCAQKKRPNVKAVVNNISKPMPLAKKLSLLIKNNAYKLAHLKNCCGHPGEPGC